MPELLGFDKDLVHLEAAPKVCIFLNVICEWGVCSSFVQFIACSICISNGQIQLKSLAEEMQDVSKGLEKVEHELTASENDGAISAGFQKVGDIGYSFFFLIFFYLFIFYYRCT
ncbi:hypothetical protein CsSME_00008177 [Camellia sinensis var. sinensis]